MASSRAAAAVVVAVMVCAVVHSATAASARGLSPSFHEATCPRLEQIVMSNVAETFRRDVGVAPALIRILFHDCFPQGCDASVLLTGNNSEQALGPNLTLRPVALDLIERIRAAVHSSCGPTVSCADITVLATRDALLLAGGSYFNVALGRHDGLAPASADLVFTLPSPSTGVMTLIAPFAGRGFKIADLVSLSGAHSFGVAHCPSFSDRFTPSIDTHPPIDHTFAMMLQAKCEDIPEGTVNQTLDVLTPDVFDNKYYIDLSVKRGLLKSDQGLFDHRATTQMVVKFLLSQTAFFEQFAKSMVKTHSSSSLPSYQVY